MSEPERPPKDPEKEAAEAKRAFLIVLLLAPAVFVFWLWSKLYHLFDFVRIPDRTNW